MSAGSFIYGILANIASHWLLKLRTSRHAANLWSRRIVSPNQKVRVSVSALLRICDSDRYVLIRNVHRPELFGPIGGVYKYKERSRPFLDRIDFQPQVFAPRDRTDSDLRGFIPCRSLSAFAKWFASGADRETADACLRREIREELSEANVSREELQVLLTAIGDSFELVRTVIEGPERIPDREYLQYRILHVFDLDDSRKRASVADRFSALSRTNENITIVSAQEIRRGRQAGGKVIGHHAGYLIASIRLRPELPAIHYP